ncbi:ribosome maturation factor RimM [Oceanivirga salmonicida]|uniref:ribosome maturation factor RimM n=1 Tax=Oceanivirga salmonicida TaxID=1769291 RepID=UPI00082E203E|nr:ribosome maturation factor RimM [Oceanivirga salmonicida]
MNEMINIGIIKGTHHLQGALKVNTGFLHFDKIKGEKVLIEAFKGMQILTIKDFKKMTDKKYIITFEEVSNVTDAKELIGASIKIRKDLLPKIDKDEYYTDDLISFRVYSDNEYIGDVIDIMETSAHDILVVQNNEKEVLVPFVQDVFIVNIDFENQKIDINLLEGML